MPRKELMRLSKADAFFPASALNDPNGRPRRDKWGIMRELYSWEKLYQAAILETEEAKLHDLIHAAKAAIDRRLKEMQSHHDETPEERHAMTDALHGLMGSDPN